MATYVAPPDGPVAKLRFRTNQDHGFTRLARIDTTNCPAGVKAQAVAAMHGKGLNEQAEVSAVHMIGSTDKPEITIRERLIEAGRPFLFSVLGSVATANATFNCNLMGRFDPEPSKEYELAYSLLIQERKCTAVIYVLGQETSGDVVRTRERTQKYFKVTEGREFCEKP